MCVWKQYSTISHSSLHLTASIYRYRLISQKCVKWPHIFTEESQHWVILAGVWMMYVCMNTDNWNQLHMQPGCNQGLIADPKYHPPLSQWYLPVDCVVFTTMPHLRPTNHLGALVAINTDNTTFKKVSIGRVFPATGRWENILRVNSVPTYSSIKVIWSGGKAQSPKGHFCIDFVLPWKETG